MTVWILNISHRHGIDTWVCASEDRAYQRLIQYVDEWWDREMENTPRPTDNNISVEKYFSNAQDEWWSIDFSEVLT